MVVISYIIAFASHVRTFASQILAPQVVVTSAHLHISDLYIFTFIFRSSYFETTSCLHTVGSSSRSHTVLSYHLQDFIMQVLSQLYNLIYLRLQDFISPLSGQPSSSCPACRRASQPASQLQVYSQSVGVRQSSIYWSFSYLVN